MGRRAATRCAAARMAWRDARVSHTANGVYAAMFMAAAHAASLGVDSAAECADVGLSVIPRESRLAEAVRTARGLDGSWEEIVDQLYERYGSLHGVHAINNTALVAAALYAFDEFSPAICAVVQGGWDTDTNGAAVGSIFGAPRPDRGSVVRPAPRPLRELAADVRRDHTGGARRPHPRRLMTDEAPAFDPLVPRPIDRPTVVPLEGPLDVLDGAKILAAPDDPADWPAWRERLAAWREDARARMRLRRRHLRPARARVDSALLLLRARLALGRAPLRPRGRPASRRTGCSTRASASSAATTGSSSGTPTR